MDSPHVTRPHPSMTAKEVRDARARAWAFAFKCFHRHQEQKGGPTAAPEDARKDQNAGTYPNST